MAGVQRDLVGALHPRLTSLKELVAALYRQRQEDVLFFYCHNALGIKFSNPRPAVSGDLEDSDVYGGQQYAPLLDIEVPGRR